jgi:hypothetical protein
MTTTTARILHTAALAVALAAAPAVVLAAPASAGATNCAATWGSQPRTADPAGEQGLQFLLNVRSGHHLCYDRVVLDLVGNESGPAGYTVQYVPTVINENTQQAVPVAGGAALQVLIGKGNYDYGSQSSGYNPADPARLVDVTGYRTLRQVAWADTFAADDTTTIAIGVRARLPMRAFLLPSATQFTGQRLVIDISHHW